MHDDETVVRRRFRVIGRVQGVGFRWWTQRRARDLGLRGTVRNCADGSVEVEAAGRVASLDALRSLLAAGPPGAAVDHVDEHAAAAADPLPDDFEIRF